MPQIDYYRFHAIVDRVIAEADKAMSKHGPIHSPHEGASVIREEYEELWDHVKADTAYTSAAMKEAIQLAAMGIRFVYDLEGQEAKDPTHHRPENV